MNLSKDLWASGFRDKTLKKPRPSNSESPKAIASQSIRKVESIPLGKYESCRRTNRNQWPEGELRGDSDRVIGNGTLRAREGLVHRRHVATPRQVRAGQRRTQSQEDRAHRGGR